MVKLGLLIGIIFLISYMGVSAAQEVDITIGKEEVLKFDFQPGTFTTIKFSPGATLDFTYGPAFGTLKIEEITPKEIKVDLSKNGGRKKTIIFKTGEKTELDLLYNDLSEIDITPTLIKTREGSEGVIVTFNSYKYSGLEGKLPENFYVLKKDKSTTDPYLVGLILGIILLGIVLLVVWKKTTKKEVPIVKPVTAPRSFDEEKLYVAGTIEKAKVQPQIPPMSILKEDVTKVQQVQPTTIPHLGVKVESAKEEKKPTKKKAPAKRQVKKRPSKA